MNLAIVFVKGNNEYINIGDRDYLAARFTYGDYAELLARNEITHVVCSLGLVGTDVGDGMHSVDDFLAAIAMFDAGQLQVMECHYAS